MKIQMPANVRKIIQTLENAGYEAFAVGGCVRDALLGKEPKDWDITTSAKPWEVKALFSRTIDTGILHGTVTVMLGREGYEVTTYRIDGVYEDGRHPKNVEFSSLLSEDLRRRDFTMNAMAYNETKGLVDVFDGAGDLAAGIIRCVGCAKERFGEDALRMMRAVRFAAQLGFTIEEKTWEAMEMLAPSIEKVSRERICVELDKMLLSDRPQMVQALVETGIAKSVLKPLEKLLRGGHAALALAAVKKSPSVRVLRYAALMNAAGEQETYALLKSLKMDNYTVKTTCLLVANVRLTLQENEYQMRKALHQFGPENLALILQNQETMAEAFEEVTEILQGAHKKHLRVLKEMMQAILERGDCYTLGGLAIGGRELMERGYRGAQIGGCLEQLLEMVMENPELNHSEALLMALEEP